MSKVQELAGKLRQAAHALKDAAEALERAEEAIETTSALMSNKSIDKPGRRFVQDRIIHKSRQKAMTRREIFLHAVEDALPEVGDEVKAKDLKGLVGSAQPSTLARDLVNQDARFKLHGGGPGVTIIIRRIAI